MLDDDEIDDKLGKRLIAETRLARSERKIERAMKKALNVHKERAIMTVDLQAGLTAAGAPPDAFDQVAWDTTIAELVTPVIDGVLTDYATWVTEFLELTPEQRAQILGSIDFGAQLEAFVANVADLGVDTATRVNEELSIGVAKGEGTAKLTKRLKEAFDIASRVAATIARTETHGAVETTTYGATYAVSAAGVTLEKHWLATSDSRTRKSHAKAEGKNGWLDMDANFIVGNGEGPHPGKIGRPEEDINCRCSLEYRTKDTP